MQAAEGKIGRVFIIRLEDGDLLPAAIERFAAEKHINNGYVIVRWEVEPAPKENDVPHDPVYSKTVLEMLTAANEHCLFQEML